MLEMSRLLNDDRYFCEKLIQIEDRGRNKIFFKFNPAQEMLYKKRTGRDLIVKAGQLGVTTFELALAFKDTITNPGTTSVIVAHEEAITQRLLNKVRVWHEAMPKIIQTDAGPMNKPYMKYDSANQKSFPKINSTIFIGTARAFVFGRGEPIHNFIGSEVAFWPDAKRILVPTMQRVPLEGTMVLESTPNGEYMPNGERNYFYQAVLDAQEDKGIWTLHALEWWFEPEYRIPVNSNLVKDWLKPQIKDYMSDELDLIHDNGWDDKEADERIRWRRRKIDEIQGDFYQEFFEDLGSCFLTSGSVYYNSLELDRLRAECIPFSHMWRDTQIWHEPDEDEHPNYMITVDPGQGKITQSVAAVWKIDPEGGVRHEATLAGLYDSLTFAPMVMELGFYYRRAKIVAERNGHGQAFCSELVIKNYPSLYKQRDIISGVATNVVGWATTGAAKIGGKGTKIYAMDELNHLLPDLECKDLNIIRQIMQVKVSPDGRISFLGMDDYHDTAMIMAGTRPSAGLSLRGKIGNKGWRW